MVTVSIITEIQTVRMLLKARLRDFREIRASRGVRRPSDSEKVGLP
jgi:hypothetical protein